MIVINWLDRFWALIGKFMHGLDYEFGSMIAPQGPGIYAQPVTFVPERIWFSCHNPRGVASDWDKINLVRVQCGAGATVNVITEVKTASGCKVSWFVHEMRH